MCGFLVKITMIAMMLRTKGLLTTILSFISFDPCKKKFSGNNAFNGNVGSWDVSKVKSMDYMFDFAHLFNQDLSGWNVASVTNADYMFYYASAFRSVISNWDGE